MKRPDRLSPGKTQKPKGTFNRAAYCVARRAEIITDPDFGQLISESFLELFSGAEGMSPPDAGRAIFSSLRIDFCPSRQIKGAYVGTAGRTRRFDGSRGPETHSIP